MPVHQFPESDCKTSPLALLVQICSNIGAEKPTTKNSSEKNGTSGGSNSNSSSNSSSDEIRVTKDKDVLSCSPANSVHSASSLTSSNRTSRGEEPSGFTSNNSKRNTPSECRSSPLLGRSSVERRTTPSSVHSPDNGVHHRPKSRGDKTPTSSSASATTSSHDSHQTTASSGVSGSSSTSEPTYSSSSLGLDFSRDGSGSLLSGKDVGSTSSFGLGSYKAGLNGLNPLALANCSGCSPVAGHIPMDASATYPLAGALKSGYSFGSALTPYMNYARMKSAAAGGATFVPVCRDPYCTNCQLAAQLPYAQDRLAAHMTGLYPGGLPGYPVPGFASPASSAFASSVLPRPNVCGWMSGDSCCGKPFASPEELLQHLRTHTSLPGTNGALPLYSSGVSLPSALAMDACGLYTTPSLTTPAGLRRTYPTSLSPVSSLTAAGRYHPYKPPGLSPLSSTPLRPLGHPGLSFYNPYGVFWERKTRWGGFINKFGSKYKI
ncbi:zinc finger protein 703-B [Trichonephila inaurata madagascariensis]|uniref:Zinc finger protein 703-B n=1 Tax=Trichonephila inaurata madagascariensis TaxID=2747483 RepID=A0A8X6YLI7_9ARAC|nr:zinc finger protein 703-B [Trichonephila inaurata madagascariensis]